MKHHACNNIEIRHNGFAMMIIHNDKMLHPDYVLNILLNVLNKEKK